MSGLLALLLTFAISVLGAVAIWRLSLRLRDAGIVDILWGYGFGVLCTVAHVLSASPGPRGVLLLGLVLLWSVRLGTHLLTRSRGRGEDFRYREMRAYHGEAFPRRSLITVFLFQAGVQWVLSLPLQVAQLWPGTAPLGWLDAIGVAVFAVGLYVETRADLELERFRRDPSTRGQVLDRGLWRYSRHPNYFGEAVIAWGIFLVILGTPYGVGFFWSPLLLTFLLVKVSGVPVLEEGLRARLPGYADYARRTPAFVPGRPRAA